MKRIFTFMLALVGLMTMSTSCLKEEISDVLVTLEVNNDINAYMGLNKADRDAVKETGDTISEAFVSAINATRLEKAGDRYWIARNQRSNKSVSEMLLEAGNSAYAQVKDIKPLIPVTVSLSIDSMFGKETIADYIF